MFLQNNMQALSEQLPETFAWIQSSQVNVAAVMTRFFQNPTGHVDWRLDSGQGLHESIAPERYYNQWIPEKGAWGGASVIVGSGVGYGINFLLQNTPDNHRILIVEPRADMLVACLGQNQYEHFIRSGRLMLAPPQPSLIQRLLDRFQTAYLFATINFRTDLNCTQLGPEYDRATRTLDALINQMGVEFSTRRKLQDTMVGNEIGNLPIALTDNSLSSLRVDQCSMPVAIIGAGPSLERHASTLRHIASKSLLVTGLQTLPALQQLGIDPDICVAIDPGEIMLRPARAAADSDAAANIALIYSTKINPEVTKTWPGPRIAMWNQGGIGSGLFAEQTPLLDSGGNVAVTMLRLFIWAGYKKFILIGQDLAWSGGQTHASGHHSSGAVEFNPRRHVRLRNQLGEELISDRALLAAKGHLESDIRAHPEIEIFNLFGGGVHIEGTQSVDAAQLAALVETTETSNKCALWQNANTDSKSTLKTDLEPCANDIVQTMRPKLKQLKNQFGKAGRRQHEIRANLRDLSRQLQSHALYVPWIFNEIIDINGLIQTRERFVPTDYETVVNIVDRIEKKLHDLDTALGAALTQSAH